MTAPAPSDKRDRASALLMVLAVLALFSILGATLAMLARLDQKAGSNFNDTQTAEDFIPDPGLDFIVSLLQGTDEQLPDDQALYDAIDAQHLWLAGVRYDSATSGLLRELSFRSSNGDPPQFNVFGRGRIYDGIHGSDIDQDGIQDAADFGRVATMFNAGLFDLNFGRFATNAGSATAGFDFNIDPASEGSRHVEVAAIIYDLEARLNVNVVGNSGAGLGRHGFAGAWGAHEVSLAPLGIECIREPILGGNGTVDSTLLLLSDDTWYDGTTGAWPGGPTVLPGELLILPGADGVLDSTPGPGGDDVVVTAGSLLEFLLVHGGLPAVVTSTTAPPPFYGRTGGDASAGAAATDDDAGESPDPATDCIDNNADGVPDNLAYIRDGGNGVPESTRQGDDVWYDNTNGAAPALVPPPGEILILAGADGILQSRVITGGTEDDVYVGCIRTANTQIDTAPIGDDVGIATVSATTSDVPADSVIVTVGPDGVLDTLPLGADDYIGALPDDEDEPDEVVSLRLVGDDMPFSVDDELYVNSVLAYPKDWEDRADIFPGSHLALLFSHDWGQQLRDHIGADVSGGVPIDNNVTGGFGNEAADIDMSGAPPIPPLCRAQYELTDGEDSDGDANSLVDNFAEGDDMVFRRLFTTVSTGTVWAGADGTAYPLANYRAWQEANDGVAAGTYDVYDLCKIPMNQIDWDEDFLSAPVPLNTAGTATDALLLDLFNAARRQATITDIPGAGLLVNLVDAFDGADDGAGNRANEGVTVMRYNITTPENNPELVDLRFAGTLAEREGNFPTLNTWLDSMQTAGTHQVVFGLEDRVPRISQIYCQVTKDEFGTITNPQYAIEIYNPEPFQDVPLENWQIVKFTTLGGRTQWYTLPLQQPAGTTFVLPAGGTRLIIGAGYAGGTVNDYNTANSTLPDTPGATPLTFNLGDVIALVKRFAPTTVHPETVVAPLYGGVVTDVALIPFDTGSAIDFPQPAAGNPAITTTKDWARDRGWRCDHWESVAGDGMGVSPPTDDCYPNGILNPNKLQLFFPGAYSAVNPLARARMTNLGDFGRIVDFQMASYDPNTNMIPVNPFDAFSRNLAEASDTVLSPLETWRVFYQFWDRDTSGILGAEIDPTSVSTLMDQVTIAAPHADGIDNDGDGAVDFADTGQQPGDRMGPEVRVPGRVNINTANPDVLRCLASVLRLTPTDVGSYLDALTLARVHATDGAFTSLGDFLGLNSDTPPLPRLDLSTTLEDPTPPNGVENNTLDDDGDGWVDEPNEALFLRGRLSNLITTRSNTFLVYLATRYIDEGARRLAIVAGADLTCNSVAGGDDIQVTPLPAVVTSQTPVILPGPNRMLDTLPAGDDLYVVGINEPLDTGNGSPDTGIAGTLVPDDTWYDGTSGAWPGTAVALPGQAIVLPGPDGVIDTTPVGDEQGWGVIIEPWSGGDNQCNTLAVGDDIQVVGNTDPAAPGQILIKPGPNGVLDTVTPLPPLAPNEDLSLEPNGAMCIRENLAAGNTCNTTAVGDDIQVVAGPSPGPAGSTTAGQVVILPGPNGRLDTVPGGDDQYDYNAMFARDDSVYVKREIMILDRAACVRDDDGTPADPTDDDWIPQVRILGRKTLSEYRKVPR